MARPRPDRVLKVRRFIDDANLVVEVRDARGPEVTSPTRYIGRVRVPRLVILTKTDLASQPVTRRWVDALSGDGTQVLALDLSGRSRAGDKLLETLTSYIGRVKTTLGIVRAVVVGLPNVGKSTLINRVRRMCVAPTGDQPGVTRGKLWVQVTESLFVLDTPGIIEISDELLKRFGPDGWKLSLLNIVPEKAMEAEDTILGFLEVMMDRAHEITDPVLREHLGSCETPMDVLIEFARSQGLRTRGGDPDITTASRRLIGRFRRREIGRISLERPGDASPDEEPQRQR